MSYKLIKEYEYQSNDCLKVILKIFSVEGGFVLEQKKIYDFDGSYDIDSVFLPFLLARTMI